MNGRTDRAVLPQTHQDEFPAEYSLAGCSPAEPASASSATLILNQKPPVRLQNSSERQPSPKARVSKHRAGQGVGHLDGHAPMADASSICSQVIVRALIFVIDY